MTVATQLRIPNEVAIALRAARMRQELSTAEVAEAADVSSSFVFVVENAQVVWEMPAEETRAALGRLCDLLDVPGSILAAVQEEPVEAVPAADPMATVIRQPASADVDPATSAWIAPRRSVPSRRHRRGPGRALGSALAAAVLSVAAAGAAVVVVSGSTGTDATPAEAAAHTGTHLTTLRSQATSATSATVHTVAPAYQLTVSAVGPCWAQVTDAGGHQMWAGMLSAGQSHALSVNGPVRVELGSSGGRLAVASSAGHAALTPPAAPYTYLITR